MNGIEKITERIEQDMGAQIAAIQQQAQQQADELTAKYEATAVREREAILARGRAAADERLQRLAGVAELDGKKLALSTKQEVVERAFTQAAERLTQLPEPQYVELLASLAARAALSGKEEIILSPADYTRYGAAVVAAANQKLAGGALTLSASTRPMQGGLLLHEGDIEINCSFESLIRLLHEDTASEVAKILFD